MYKDKGNKFAIRDYKFLDQVIIRRDINQLSLITRLQRRFDYKFGKENLCLITIGNVFEKKVENTFETIISNLKLVLFDLSFVFRNSE